VALVCIAFLVAIQAGPGAVIEVAKRASPEAKWSQPIPFSSSAGKGFFLQATSEVQVYEGTAQPQRAAPPEKVLTEPKLVATRINVDQLLIMPDNERQQGNIPWPEVSHDPNVLEVGLGFGHGHRWYGKGSLAFLLSVRRGAKLRGGEDLKNLYIRALPIEDDGMYTRNTAVGGLLHYKDSAVPLVAAEIARNDPRTKVTAIRVLSGIRTPKAALELLNVFQHGSQLDRGNVCAASSYKPYMAGLKPVYAYTLNRDGERTASARAIAFFGWKEFLPQLRKQLPLARSSDEALAIYETIDQFAGHQLSPQVRDASASLIQWEASEHSVRTLLKALDKTHVALVGLTLLTFGTKGETPFPGFGLRLLDSVPSSVSAPLVKRFHSKALIDAVRKRIANHD
jgi:hypothetical protein